MDINEVFQQLAEYKRMQEETAAIIDGLQDQIKAYMTEGHKSQLIGSEHKATYKEVVSHRLDTKALKKDMPEVAAAYTKPCKAMRFSFS